ncbi:hypothetical protein ABXN37_11485 [Piscinibacter sakaiensis]|uniref:hypothetical protein n=1 Tax=Piscinibacter sakaiensis TaxID=1547922 RepID=UPI003726C526
MKLATTDRSTDRLHQAAHVAERAALRAADSAEQALQDTRRAANATFDRLDDSVQALRAGRGPGARAADARAGPRGPRAQRRCDPRAALQVGAGGRGRRRGRGRPPARRLPASAQPRTP